MSSDLWSASDHPRAWATLKSAERLAAEDRERSAMLSAILAAEPKATEAQKAAAAKNVQRAHDLRAAGLSCCCGCGSKLTCAEGVRVRQRKRRAQKREVMRLRRAKERAA